jgi:alkylation response protein AidB-like acyl-CoA dehydrogenase
MDFGLTEEQKRFGDSIVEFARANLNEGVADRDRKSSFSRAGWQKCADFGLLGLPVPDSYGGSDADPITIATALEALGYGCRDSGLIFSLNAQMWSCQAPILRFGTDAQKEKYLPRLVDGSIIGVQGMTEPDSGSDAFGLRTTARLDGDSYVLKGSKTFVSNATEADIFVIFASTDPEQGFAGISAFLVGKGSPGFEIGPSMEKMGLRTSPMSELFFEDCMVGTQDLLGKPGAGMAVFNHSMDWERGFILAGAVGTMRRVVEATIEHARSRKQFGRAISEFQAVSHRIVDMQLRLETARLLLYKLAWLRSQGEPTQMHSAMAKLHLSESLVASALDAFRTFGGYGFMAGSDAERDLRDALGGLIYSGTSDIQRNIIAGQLGL